MLAQCSAFIINFEQPHRHTPCPRPSTLHTHCCRGHCCSRQPLCVKLKWLPGHQRPSSHLTPSAFDRWSTRRQAACSN